MTPVFRLLTTLLLLPSAALPGAETSRVQITDYSIIFTHTSTDPKDPANTSGFNQGPSIVLLPDGRVMAAWFTSPSEGAESQRIVQAFSSDQGRTWSEATVLQDFAGKADLIRRCSSLRKRPSCSSPPSIRRSTSTSAAAATRRRPGRSR